MTTDGGPAFPAELSDSGPQVGMFLRDYLAAKAMQAFIASDTQSIEYPDKHQMRLIAIQSYEMADAMLQERAKA